MTIYHHCSLHCVQAMLSYQIRSKNLRDICANCQGLEASLRFMPSCKASFVWSISVLQCAVPGWGDRQPSTWFMVLTSLSLCSPPGAVHRLWAGKLRGQSWACQWWIQPCRLPSKVPPLSPGQERHWTLRHSGLPSLAGRVDRAQELHQHSQHQAPA